MVSHAVWKTWPSGLSNDKNLGLRPRFLSTESLGPCFPHGMGDHDQILQHIEIAWHQIPCLLMPCPLPGLGPIPEELEFLQFKFWNWNWNWRCHFNSRIFFTIHLKFIPPTAKTSFKPNFELDNGYIPWFFSFYFLVIDICPNNGEIALLTN